MKRLRTGILVALGSLVLAGCTLVAPNAAPEHLAASQVPFSLLRPTIPGTNGARVRFVTQAIFIVDAEGHLAAVSRIVPGPPTLSTVIGQLLLGPTTIEKSAGFTTALPPKLVLISGDLRDHVAYLDFTTSLANLAPKSRLLAIGQLVLTASTVGASKGVVVEVAGAVQALPLPNGSSSKLVTARDYLSMLSS